MIRRRILRRILLGGSALVALGAIGAVLHGLLDPPAPIPYNGPPSPALATAGPDGIPEIPDVTPTPSRSKMAAKEVMAMIDAIDPAPKKAESHFFCYCPGAVIDGANLGKMVAIVTSMTSILKSALQVAVNVEQWRAAFGQHRGGQWGTPAPILALPALNLGAITAISLPSASAAIGSIAGTVSLPSLPSLKTFSLSQSWVQNTFSTTATDSGSLSAITARQTTAYSMAAQSGYGIAIQQRAQTSALASENTGVQAVGDAPTDAVGQVAALGNTAATLYADVQHLTALEEASLELSASGVMKGGL